MFTLSVTQNRFFTTLVFIFVLITNVAFGQVETNFVRSFSGQFNIVKLDLGENVEVKTWDNPTVRIVINVRFTQQNMTMNIVKGFAELGRYTLESDLTAKDLRITATQINHRLKLNGHPVKDQIRYTVYVPKNVELIKSREEFYALAKP